MDLPDEYVIGLWSVAAVLGALTYQSGGKVVSKKDKGKTVTSGPNSLLLVLFGLVVGINATLSLPKLLDMVDIAILKEGTSMENTSLQAIAPQVRVKSSDGVAVNITFFPELQICNTMKMVNHQYMNYPYPPRDPADEKKRIVMDPNNCPLAFNHYIHGGKYKYPMKSNTNSKPFRVLVAGGGTGDATVMMAVTFKNAGINAQIVHLDLSTASLDIAEKRVAMHGIQFVKFVEGSILDVASLNLGTFDFIDCVGVLHHLENPSDGLNALASVLRPDGGMMVMVYGALGRHGVYHFQDMYKLLQVDLDPSLAREMITALPDTNWIKRNPSMLSSDIKKFGDNGVVDLLLHHCDSAYRVPEVFAFADSAGLEVMEFSNQRDYEVPVALAEIPEIKESMKQMDWGHRAALAELAKGTMNKQSFYMAKKGAGLASATNPAVEIASSSDHPVQSNSIICRHDRLMGYKWTFSDDILQQAYANPEYHLSWVVDRHQHERIPAMAAASSEFMNCKDTVKEIWQNHMKAKLPDTVTYKDYLKAMRRFYTRLSCKYARYWFITYEPFNGLPADNRYSTRVFQKAYIRPTTTKS